MQQSDAIARRRGEMERSKASRSQRAIVVSIACACAVLCALVLFAMGLLSISEFLGPSKGQGRPSDASLMVLFEEHEEKFTQLRDMILSEADILSIGNDNVGPFWLYDRGWVRSDNSDRSLSEQEMLEYVGLETERYCVYLDLLRSVGGYRVTKRTGGLDEGEVGIHIFRAGLAVSGDTKGILYSPAVPMPIVPDTADEASRRKRYSVIRDGWYVAYED